MKNLNITDGSGKKKIFIRSGYHTNGYSIEIHFEGTHYNNLQGREIPHIQLNTDDIKDAWLLAQALEIADQELKTDVNYHYDFVKFLVQEEGLSSKKAASLRFEEELSDMQKEMRKMESKID